MADPQALPSAIPWYKSNVLRGLLIVVVTHTLTHYKLISQFTPIDIGTFVDELLSVVGYAAAAFSAYSRVASPNPAVTTTKAKADVLNASQSAPAPAVIISSATLVVPQSPEPPKS